MKKFGLVLNPVKSLGPKEAGGLSSRSFTWVHTTDRRIGAALETRTTAWERWRYWRTEWGGVRVCGGGRYIWVRVRVWGWCRCVWGPGTTSTPKQRITVGDLSGRDLRTVFPRRTRSPETWRRLNSVRTKLRDR